jgi:two-component system C4-dicarboxylate transport response regulator DctD
VEKVDAEATALVVDGRSESRSAVADALMAAGFGVVEAENGLEGWQGFCRVEPDLVVSELRVPAVDGLELLRRVRGASQVPVILLSAEADVPSAIEAIRAGAAEFLRFPDDLGHLVERARELTTGPRGARIARRVAARFVGVSEAARRLRERVIALAPLPVPVLVTGEPGTGRDHVVRCLHRAGALRDESLVTVEARAAAPPRRLACGAFYLDEVGRFDLADQVRWGEWLREAEERGANRTHRLYASSSEDIASAIRAGTLHPPLARRLQRFRVNLSPLRERRQDIPSLASSLAERFGRELGRRRTHLAPGALALLRERTWPGNVRELASAVEKLVAFSPDGAVTRGRAREVMGEAADSVASLRSLRNQQQREELLELIERCGGNLAEVARRLDLSRGAVIYRAQKHGLLARSGH